MTLLRLTIDLILRLLDSSDDADAKRVDREIEGLLLLTNSAWLPEDVEDGVDAFEELWHVANEAQQEKLIDWLCNRGHVWTSPSDPTVHRLGLASLFCLAARGDDSFERLVEILNRLTTESLVGLIYAGEDRITVTSTENWIINGWLTLSVDLAGIDPSQRELALVKQISDSNVLESKKFFAVGKVWVNAFWQNRHDTVRQAFPIWADMAKSISSAYLDAVTLKPTNLQYQSNVPIVAPQLLYECFYRYIAELVFSAKPVTGYIQVLTKILERDIANRPNDDGTFGFISQTIFRDELVEKLKQKPEAGADMREYVFSEPNGIPGCDRRNAPRLLQLTRRAEFECFPIDDALEPSAGLQSPKSRSKLNHFEQNQIKAAASETKRAFELEKSEKNADTISL